MDNRSMKEIKEDINSKMNKLGKLVVAKMIMAALSFISLIIAIINFLLIGYEAGTKSGAVKVVALCMLFMVFSIIFIASYALIDSVCNETKRIIYNDKRVLKRLTK